MAKKKKEKVIYYDDGSTIVDMQGVTRDGKKKHPLAVKRMIVPMVVVLIVLGILYLFLMLIGGNL